jgi:hypothetical protein
MTHTKTIRAFSFLIFTNNFINAQNNNSLKLCFKRKRKKICPNFITFATSTAIMIYVFGGYKIVELHVQ